MTTTTIWTWGPDPEPGALAAARDMGFADPVVARTVTVQGQQFAGVAVVVSDGEDEAAAHRLVGRRGRPRRAVVDGD